MTVVLKLGGSVITDKSTPETLDETALTQAAEAVATHDQLVLVHGGGSFGHYHASEHEITSREGSHDAADVLAVHNAMGRLNDAVLAALHDRGLPALPVDPLAAAARDRDGTLSLMTTQVKTMFEEGFIPVLHGDIVAHAGRGVTVVSGDEVVVALAAQLNANRVGLCSAVPGVLNAEGKVIERIESFDAVKNVLGDSDGTDVTGGMSAKVRVLLDLDAPAWVFGLDGLGEFIDGRSPGTKVG